jgi:group I intron endonuclease
MGIYIITCVATGSRYIGSAVSIGHRWASHRSLARRGKHPNIHLQRTWTKHGEQSFVFQIVEAVRERTWLRAVEQTYLDWTFQWPNLTMNLSRDATETPMGCWRGRKHSEETKRKISRGNKGKTRTKEMREINAAARRGISHPHTPESRAKISLANKGLKRTEEQRAAMRKRVVTAEARAKMSRSQRARKPPSEESRRKMSESGKAHRARERLARTGE